MNKSAKNFIFAIIFLSGLLVFLAGILSLFLKLPVFFWLTAIILGVASPLAIYIWFYRPDLYGTLIHRIVLAIGTILISIIGIYFYRKPSATSNEKLFALASALLFGSTAILILLKGKEEDKRQK